MEVICVVNPKASDGACLRKWPVIESALKHLGAECRLVSREGDLGDVTTEILAEIAEAGLAESAILAAVGGDGTQHAVVNGVRRFQKERPTVEIPPYVPIPMGTGNNIAKSLFEHSLFSGKTALLKSALNAIVDGAVRDMDLGLVATGGDCDGKYFLDAFSIGADASILAAKDAASARLAENHPLAMSLVKGYPLYAWHGVSTLAKFKSVEAKVVVDGEEWYSGPLFNMVVNDTAIYGGEFDLTGSSFPDDGMLDAVISIGPIDHLATYARGFRRLPRSARRFGILPNGAPAVRSGKTFKIELSAPIDSQIDGELASSGESFELTVAPGALKTKVGIKRRWISSS